MIKTLSSLNEYNEFINSFMKDELFSDPMLTTNEQVQSNLFNSVNKTNNTVLGCFNDSNEIIGLFVFLIEKEEKYGEMLVGLSRQDRAYKEIFNYLEEQYKDMDFDFVYNPNNFLISEELLKRNAFFETEQQKLKLKEIIPYQSKLQIELLSERYNNQYISIHNTNMYWTGSRVIEAKNRFKTLIALSNGNVVGYIDFTHCFDENEPYDLYVLPEYRGAGYGKALLNKAIEMNYPKKMMVLVDIDNSIAINLYKSLGFETINGENNITAHLHIM